MAAGGEPISRDQFTITGHAVVRRLKLSLSMGRSLDARADNAAQKPDGTSQMDVPRRLVK
jgi:hypothetical protein